MIKLISFEGEDMIQTPLFSIIFYTLFVTNSRCLSIFLQHNLRLPAVVDAKRIPLGHGHGPPLDAQGTVLCVSPFKTNSG